MHLAPHTPVDLYHDFDLILGRLSLVQFERLLPGQPDLIPYRTSYYTENWAFCMPHRQLEALRDETYEVSIDSSLENGHLSYGEYLHKGETEDEFLLSAHVCHPSLANDNCSGIALLTQLAKRLSQTRTRFSYRFLFAPGTIGGRGGRGQSEGDTAARGQQAKFSLPSPSSSLAARSGPGLRLSWIVYRGKASAVTLAPDQMKTWMDTRPFANSPWSPPYLIPEPPPDNKWTVTATFATPGTYDLRAVASDGSLFTYDSVTVDVTTGAILDETTGRNFGSAPFSPVVRQVIRAAELVPYVGRRLTSTTP